MDDKAARRARQGALRPGLVGAIESEKTGLKDGGSAVVAAPEIRYPEPRWFPSGIKRERGESGDAQGHGCPRNCKRLACPPICDHWETGKVGGQAATRESGDLPSLVRPISGEVSPMTSFQVPFRHALDCADPSRHLHTRVLCLAISPVFCLKATRVCEAG